MWMTNYIDAIKRGFIDQYGFPENPNKPGCVLGKVPDGSYKMIIDNNIVQVDIVNGLISFQDVDTNK